MITAAPFVCDHDCARGVGDSWTLPPSASPTRHRSTRRPCSPCTRSRSSTTAIVLRVPSCRCRWRGTRCHRSAAHTPTTRHRYVGTARRPFSATTYLASAGAANSRRHEFQTPDHGAADRCSALRYAWIDRRSVFRPIWISPPHIRGFEDASATSPAGRLPGSVSSLRPGPAV